MDEGIVNLLNFIEDIKAKVSLVDIAKEDAELVQCGDAYLGFSPYDELSRDNYLNRRLVVKDDKFYSISTGDNGDILDYIMKTRHLTFKEAVEHLAGLAGEKMPSFEAEIEERVKMNEHKERLYRLMQDTMVHFFNNLRDPRAKIAVDYLENRGFDKILSEDSNGKVKIVNPIVCTFALGFSLDEHALVDSMLSKGYTIEEMDECGLVYVKNGRATDIMAGRLIIPIRNRHGKVIAFSGRIFEAKGHQKYRNTSNTILFSKKCEIYGANNLPALSHQGKLSEVFVVEGYMDVISLYKEGIKNAVASMGTALTSDHARILKNYSSNIYLTYDGDNAGQDAIRRGVDVLYAEGVMPKVITLPGGEDPDEIIKNHGVEYFLDLKHSARNMIEYKIDDLSQKYNLDEADDRGEYAVKAIEIIRQYTSKLDGEKYLERVSNLSGISIEVLTNELYNSKVDKLASGDAGKDDKPLTPKEKALVYILYDMLISKEMKSLAGMLTNRDENIAYNYMRLMGASTSEEEFGDILSGNIATNVALLKSMDDKELKKASEDSLRRLNVELMRDINTVLTKGFSSETSIESKYIINDAIIALSRRMKSIAR